jgi:hypothetical protein
MTDASKKTKVVVEAMAALVAKGMSQNDAAARLAGARGEKRQADAFLKAYQRSEKKKIPRRPMTPLMTPPLSPCTGTRS